MWAGRLAWATRPTLVVASLVLSLIAGTLPAGLALVARGLVNATVKALEAGANGLGPIIPWIVLGLVLTILESAVSFVTQYVTTRLRDELHFTVNLRIAEHSATLDIEKFEDPAFLDLLQRARSNPGERTAGLVSEVINTGRNILQLVSLLAVLVFIEPMILLVAAVLALPYLILQIRIARSSYALEKGRTERRRWSNYFVNLLSGRDTVSEIRILGISRMLLDRFRALIRNFLEEDRRLQQRYLALGAAFSVLAAVAVYAALVRVVQRVLSGELTLGDIAIFGGAALRLRNAVDNSVRSSARAVEHTLFIRDIREFLEARPRRSSDPRPESPIDASEIELRNVSFTYPGSASPALRGIDLHIRPGETVAFVGENGAGKTTLVKLIARLYEPQQGSILIGGKDSTEISPAAFQREIAIVFQGFGRYETTARENLAFGDWQRLESRPEEVEAIARAAGVHELIAGLPEGYDTLLGRSFGSAELSGGQWQRIAVARAFARKASLMILDEPTSNLDARSEAELFERFQQLAVGRTTLLVSHRFSTVSLADRIVVLSDGAIVEVGSHAELLDTGGVYAQLYDLHRRHLD